MHTIFPEGWKSYGELRRHQRMYLRHLAKQGPLWREVYAVYARAIWHGYQG